MLSSVYYVSLACSERAKIPKQSTASTTGCPVDCVGGFVPRKMEVLILHLVHVESNSFQRLPVIEDFWLIDPRRVDPHVYLLAAESRSGQHTTIM